MFLDLRYHNYDKDVVPFIKNGIIVDTSVFKIIVDGIVCTRFTKIRSQELEKILKFLDFIKVNNRWSKFFITPHVLTEICTHLRNDYSKTPKYKEIIKEVIPIIGEMGEKSVTKDEILELIDFQNPVVEVGDISIFVTVNNFTNNKVKIAILANDHKLNERYKYNTNVLVLDYQSNIVNLL